MKKVNIGLIGLGTIGRGVYKILQQKRAFFKEQYDIDFHIAKVCDQRARIREQLNIPAELFTRNYQDIINDKEIDTIIELVGGIHPAYEIIVRALQAKKCVVTANKALLAAKMPEIFARARRSQAQLRFEASVGGGIPIIKALTEGLVANRIESIFGIINGTSNYILSKMSEEGRSFFEALKEAQKKGFAERNPNLDIKGLDSAHKLSVLAFLAFGKYVLPEKIYTKGIDEISELDIQYAKDLGLVVKLLAIAKRVAGNELEIRVHPTLISEHHPLANIGGVLNAVYVRGDLVGKLIFSGKGAGQLPTASAIIGDLVDSVNNKIVLQARQENSIKKVKSMDNAVSKYYLRFMVLDKTGVLAKIAGVLARHKISISSVHQKEKHGRRSIPVVMLTHEAREKDIRLALDRIDQLTIVKKRTVALHREDL